LPYRKVGLVDSRAYQKQISPPRIKYRAGKKDLKQLVITVAIFSCQRLLQETINKPNPRQQHSQEYLLFSQMPENTRGSQTVQ
jgi:hypothetical protein